MKRALAILTVLIFMPGTSFGEEPCFTYTSTSEIDLEPRTPLEHVYYGAAVCYRKKWQDAVSATKSATTSVAARDERIAEAIAPQAEVADPVLVGMISGAIALALGILAGVGLSRTFR